MAKAIYLTAAELKSGKSIIALGIIEAILRQTTNIGVYRPIIKKSKGGNHDSLLKLLIHHFHLKQEYSTAFSYYRKSAIELMQKNEWENVLDKIIQDYKELEKKYDFILVIGSDLKKDLQAVDTNINVNIVQNLNIPVLIVGRGDNAEYIEDIIEPAVNHAKQYMAEDCELTGVIINSAHKEISHEILIKLRNTLALDDVIFAVIPISQTIKSPTVGEIAKQIKAKVLYGKDFLENPVFKYTVAAMKPENFLDRLYENCLVMTPGDRDDVILAVLQANISKNYPQIAGILLSTGYKPKPQILKLIEGQSNAVPMLLVKTNTFETALNLENVESTITTKHQKKIDKAIHLFEKYVNVSSLEKRISNIVPKGITPRMFQYEMAEKAKKNKKRIVLPEGNDIRILQATHYLLSKDIVAITLLGEKDKIIIKATENGIDLNFNDLEIINPKKSEYMDKFVQEFVQLRKHKGANKAIALDTMADPSYFGTMMVQLGYADGMVSGAVNTTAHTIRPALQLIKTKKDVSIVSSIFFMCMHDRVLVYGDCAINPTPNAEQLSEIAKASAITAKNFGITPLVSLLSYSSGNSGSGEDVEKVRKAAEILKQQNVNFLFEGPIQYDAAVDPQVAKTKMPDSKVAGKSNVLIFPDLNTGNNTYKAVQRETGAIAIGPILQGLKKPVNDLSRGCNVTDIINTIIITVIQQSE